MEKDIRLIALDIAGTTLTSDAKILPSTVEAIRAAHAKGIGVTICTGRNFGFTRAVREALGIKLPIVCMNGAVVQDALVTYESKPMEKEAVDAVFDIAQECSIPVFAFDERYMYVPNRKDTLFLVEQWLWMSGGTRTDETSSVKICDSAEAIRKELNGNCCKMLLSAANRDDFDMAVEKLKKTNTKVANSAALDLDIFSPETSKGEAVKSISRILGVGMDNVMTFGDGENDVEMTRDSAIGVAMGNGAECLKAVADMVTLTNDEGGIAHALKHYGVI